MIFVKLRVVNALREKGESEGGKGEERERERDERIDRKYSSDRYALEHVCRKKHVRAREREKQRMG